MQALHNRVETEREARERAEARQAAQRERAIRLEAERDALQTELGAWAAGGALTRAFRALLFRRGR